MNEKANEKHLCIKSEAVVSGDCSFTLRNSQRKFMYVYNKKNARGKKIQKSQSFPWNEKVGGKTGNQMSISENCLYLGGFLKHLEM